MRGHTGLGWLQTVLQPNEVCGKPRCQGLTMVIDKGLGRAATTDLLDMAANHVDFLKLGFGTSLVYPPGVLEDKIALAQSYGVAIYPGGTLLEVAELQGTAEAWLERACRLGFNAIEVSEGTIQLTPARRRELIQSATSRGLRVVTEVGKKQKGTRLEANYVHDQVAADLSAGAEKVIIEGRDSGRSVGVYDDEGRLNESLLEAILAGVPDPTVVIWEAPMVTQQQQLIIRLGPTVNLGNVQPEDVITLAATRVGLRGDTFRLYAEEVANKGTDI